MIRLHVLASGSSGNAALLQLGEQRLLLDAGIPYRRLSDRLADAEVSIEAVDAVLITHEHRDHVQALPQLVKRHPRLPIHASPGTVGSWRRGYNWRFGARPLVPGRPVRLGDAAVRPFATRHDATQPIGLTIAWRGLTVGLATDLGSWDRGVCEALAGCQLVLLESNYDPTMLAYGPYPPYLKRRVASKRGHLSNTQTRALLHRTAGRHLQQVVLVHLSGENNRPDTALDAVRPALTRLPHVGLVAACRHQPTAVIEIEPRRAPKRPAAPKALQLALPL